MKAILRKHLLILAFTGLSLPGFSQFYNGHQMSFGKNRVQFNEFVWSFYRHEKYDVYFNEDGKNLADYTADYAEQIIPRVEAFFDYTMEKRILFVVYNRLTDFRQSNIGLVTGKDEYNIGGTTNVSRNKAFLYFEGDFDGYDEQIVAAITRIVVNEMLNGSDLLDNVTSSTLITVPKWYSEGLVAYLSKQWDIETENVVKDGIVNGRYEKFNRLTGDDAVYAGHSFWKYIADTYGETVIPNIIYLTSISKSIKTGFLNVLGLNLKDLSYEWTGYYLNLFADDAGAPKTPDSGKMLKKTRKGVRYEHIRISPTGNYITYVTNDMGLYKIWTLDVKTGKKKKILRREHRLEQITDYSYPVIAWHPSARYIAFITEEKGGLKLYYYNIAEEELTVRNFLYFDKVLSFSFSQDGSKFVFSGTRLGKTDIYIYDIASSTNQQITNDVADDLYPRFMDWDRKIIFSSNRLSDTLSVANGTQERAVTNELFIYDYKGRSDVLMRLNDNSSSNNFYPEEIGENRFIQLSDESGTVNRYVSTFDSTVSFIDTTIHYRYFAETAPLTQFSRNILEQDYQKSPGLVADVVFNEGRYNIYMNPLDEQVVITEKAEVTPSQKARRKKWAARDSIRNLKKKVIPITRVADNTVIDGGDTITLESNAIDVNNYLFEVEKLNSYNEQLEKNQLKLTADTSENTRPKIRLYRPAFYQSNMVAQIDFNFLNASYQAFTGGAFYFNPGFNILLKIGANDLFEDLKITGGVRLSPDFDANEYLLSFESLKNRLDKMFVFHRQVFKNEGYFEGAPFVIKTHSHIFSAILRYPLNQVKSLSATLSYRNDRTVFLSSNISPFPSVNFLSWPNIYRNWLGIKLEYVFDNTRSLGINLYSGTRYKLFAEVQEQVDKGLSELVVFGADFRNYTRLHRTLIWANRFAWSSSQGSSRIIYYLGGVDNWINFGQRPPYFTPFSEIPIDETQNYAFQAVGTNMRGFSQNIRNGNNFAVFNSEIRFPVFKYLANYPLSRSFFENFQLVGFFDMGSAWSGPTPWSSHNAYDNEIIQQGPYKIIVDAQRDPIVAGYGFGIHTQLLGYFMRFDWAWGIENREIVPQVFYFSMSLDF
ncbi:MAG: hypothetical protein R6X09_02820 [Bacteroidales bacterium]